MAQLEQLIRAHKFMSDVVKLKTSILDAQATDGYLEMIDGFSAQVDDDMRAAFVDAGLTDPSEPETLLDVLRKAVSAQRAAMKPGDLNDASVTAKLNDAFTVEAAAAAVAVAEPLNP